MKNHDSHVYLYAKKHYEQRPDIFDDLKKIYSVRNGVEEKYMSKRDVLCCLLNLVTPFVMKNEGMFLEFISDIDPRNTWRVNYAPKDAYDFEYAVAHKCLSVLSLTRVVDIPGGLDEPDPKILPLRREKKA